MAEDLNSIKKNCESKMKKAVDHLLEDYKAFRTGRANTAILDSIMVDYYGEKMKVNQVGNVTTPDAHTIIIDPWDKSALSIIEKAISTSNLGINPVNDGKVIRLPIPPLTEERRKEMTKQAKKKAEDAKVVIRNIRRDTNEHIKKSEKELSLSEDDIKKSGEEIQKQTDKYIKEIDNVYTKKEKEILEV